MSRIWGAPEGTIRVWSRDGGRQVVKVGKEWIKYYRWVWERANGRIPKGYQIHHKDLNPMNDALDNLQLLTNSEHKTLHLLLRTKRGLPGTKKGTTAWNKGLHSSEETKKKQSESLKGTTAWNKGLHSSEETKKKQSESHIGKKLSAESIAKGIATQKRNRELRMRA